MKNAIDAGKTANERGEYEGAEGKGEKANAAAKAARVTGGETKISRFLVLN